MEKTKNLMPRLAAYTLANAMNKVYEIPAQTPKGFVELNVLDLRGIKFSIVVHKTKNKLQSLINEMESKRNIPNPKILQEFNDKRIAECKKLCDKDEKGEPVMVRNGNRMEFTFTDENRKALDVVIDNLVESEKFKPYFDKAKADYKKFSEEEIDFDELIHYVKEEDLSCDITANIIEDIAWMIL
jgi:hypothetical protein